MAELKAAGAEAVATYIPWLVHELPDGPIDVTGETADWRDLGAFCDLAAELGLLVIARPGPYCMAELKNEGLPAPGRCTSPAWSPTAGAGAPPPTRDLDYLSPAFLTEAERWYDAVLPVLAARLHPTGGPVIGGPVRQRDRHAGLGLELPGAERGVAADLLDWLDPARPADRHAALSRHPGPRRC